MSIKNILVAYNGTQGAQQALAIGALMAKKYDAHLTGALTHGLPSILYSYGSHLPQSAMQQLEDADRDHRAEVKTKFTKATEDLHLEKTHFLDVFGDANTKLIEVARTYDVIVMGVPEKHSHFQHMEVHPDVIARNSGRPVFVVPEGFTSNAVSEKVLLAWDGRRAAARAMSNAMAILEEKSEVNVLTVGSKEESMNKLDPIVTHLNRHGITTKALQREKGKGGIAKCILDTIEETGSEMLVMGAYEHSKLAEDLFGGVTNTILAEAKVPILLSH